MNNTECAKMFCNAIRRMANCPDAIDNLESYLSYHFDEWMKKWANCPTDLAAEMKEFSQITNF